MTTQNYQPQVNLSAVEPAAREKWRLGMLVTLAILGALALVFMYYRWFGNTQPADDASVSMSATPENPGDVNRASSRKTSSKHRADTVVPSVPEAQLTLDSGITQSAIRSPLAVEVISGGGQHQIITTRNDAIYLGSNDKTPASADAVTTNTASETAAADPVLAKQQTLEGSVVLQARIDKEGNIQSLQAISGPEILFSAAREAVKQWRFKPYYASGEAVETQAQITVKFAISAH